MIGLLFRNWSDMEGGRGRGGIYCSHFRTWSRRTSGILFSMLEGPPVSRPVRTMINCPALIHFLNQVAEGARLRGASKIIAVDLNPDKFEIGGVLTAFLPSHSP